MEAGQILDCGQQQGGVVFESADASVTRRAKQFSDGPSKVRVVNIEKYGAALDLSAGRKSADTTDAVLSGKHGVVVGESYAISSAKIIVAPLVIASKFFLDYFSHIWRWSEGWNKCAGHVMGSRVFIADVKMNMHGALAEHLTTIAAGSEFPATGTQTDYATTGVSFRFIFGGIIDSARAKFAFPVSTISASRVFIKIIHGLDLLTAGARLVVSRNWWNRFTDFLPVSTKFLGQYVFAAETALDCFSA